MSCTLMKSSLMLVVLAMPLGLGARIASAQTISVLYNFGTQAGDPSQGFYSGIIAQGRDGNLYSGSSAGGANDVGATYKVTPGGTLTTLDSFGGSGASAPYGGLTLGTDGNFYGTAYSGGFGNDPYGTVFKMTPQGGLSTLYVFTGGNDGSLPSAPPIQGADGNFYGTTCPGCNNQAGTSSIYKITPKGVFSVLYDCDGIVCWQPRDPLLLGTDGNFYGTSTYGGTTGGCCGSIFKITAAGKPTVLYSFDNTHGEFPIGPLVQGNDGNFYGTALDGGAFGYGVVFKLTPAGKLTVLHNMNGTTDGGIPYAGLVQATDGNFYGANESSGATSTNCPNGCGTVFKITAKGAFSVIYNFDLTTGQGPLTTLLQHTNGLLYGTTQSGGTGNAGPYCSAGSCGVIYSVNIGAAPFVTFVGAPVAKVGKAVEILGQGLTGATSVSFGGAPASFKFVSDTYLTATVPSGATTATVTVVTPGGTLSSNKPFRVTPQVTSFTPPNGPVGTPVTITGVSLTQAKAVTFGGVKATSFTVNSDTQVTATVPPGAKTGKIGITTAGGTASSATSFTVN